MLQIEKRTSATGKIWYMAKDDEFPAVLGAGLTEAEAEAAFQTKLATTWHPKRVASVVATLRNLFDEARLPEGEQRSQAVTELLELEQLIHDLDEGTFHLVRPA